MIRSGRPLILLALVFVFSAVSSAERSREGEIHARPLAEAEPPPPPAAPRQYQMALYGDQLALITDRGEEVLRVPARLDVNLDGKPRSLQGTWEPRGENRAVAHADNERLHVVFEVRGDPKSPFVDARVHVRHKDEALVGHQVWSLELLDVKGRVLDRAYKWRALDDKELALDRWTPLVGQLMTDAGPAFAFVGDDDFEGVRISERHVHLEVDHWANHPHTVYKGCHQTYAPHRPEIGLSRRLASAGEERERHLRIVVGRGKMPVLRRWPEDRQAAFALVDHADSGRAEALRALLYGDSTGEDEERGLFGNGLVLTRTSFDHPRQMGDPDYRALLDELAARGGEVAPHSITPRAESAERVARSLSSTFEAYRPRTWVDHQPDTNCEAINNRGGRRGHKGNVVSVLQQSGVRYLWEAPDPDYDGDLNLLRATRPVARAPFFYPAPTIGDGRPDPWLFTTAWMFIPADELARRLSARPLDRLQAEHGVHLAHTYLAAVHRAEQYRDNTIFRRAKHGVLTTRADVEGAWTRLGKRHKKRELWVTTVGDLGDWLSTWDAVRLEALGPTRVRVTHDASRSAEQSAPRAREGFTVAARYQGRVDGQRRAVVGLGDELEVFPPIYEEDLGTSLMPAARVAKAGVLGLGYAAPPASTELFAVARDLGAPGTALEEPCALALRGGQCARTALEPFYERLDGLLGVGEGEEAERARVVVFGNSLIASDRVTDIVRQRLQHRFGDGGRGIVYVDALKYFGRRAWTGEASGAWYPEYLTQYLGERPAAAYPLGITGGHFVAYAEGARTTWRTGGAERAELLWLDHERAPSMKLLVDGRVTREVTPRRTGEAALVEVDLPRGSSELQLVTDGPRAVIYGATLERPEPGVVLDTIGIVAASANSYLKTDPAVFQSQLRARDPSLVVLMLGGNEARRIDRGVFTKEEVRRDFSLLLERVRAAVPDAACLTVGPIETVFVHTPRDAPFQTRPYVDYVVDTERRLSLRRGCGFIDLFEAMGGPGSLKKLDRRGYLAGDRIHPRGDGLDMLGELTADALLRAYASSRPYRADALASMPGSHDALLHPRDEDAPGEGELLPPSAGRLPAGPRSAP